MPKRVGYLYERMLDKEVIRSCIITGSRGKRKRQDVKEVLSDVDGYTEKVYKLLETETYVPTVPRKIRIFDNSCRKERYIKVVPYYPDGIIQQLAVYAMKDVLMRGMYRWSCASIPGRGHSCAANYVKKHLKEDPKGTKYCGKFDIHHYYPTISKQKMMDALRRKIKDEKFLNLVEMIIRSDPDPGISIGFYLNQWLANFFLEPLDHFICTLKGVKYYVRNMDDIVILGGNKKKLHRAREHISRYLETMLGLQLKDNWQIFKTDSRGIDFVGFRFFHGRTILRRRNFQKLRRNARTARRFLETHRKIPPHVAAGLLSRAGQLRHCNGQNIFDKYIKPIGINRLKAIVRKETLRRMEADHDTGETGNGKDIRSCGICA